MNHLENLVAQNISFKSLRLIRLDLPQKEVFKSGIGIRKSREALIIEWEDQNGVKGYGESSSRPDPYYSDEFIEGSNALIKQFVIPFLKKEQSFGDIVKLLDKIRGWNFTKAAIEMAALKVIEQNTGISPFDTINKNPLKEVPVGISMGLYTDLDHMRTSVQSALDTGYRRLKFKISPAVRTDFFDAVNPILLKADTYVSFDANGSFGEDDFDTLGYFVNTYKTMVEQPIAPGRYDVLLKAKERFPDMFVCFDEEVKSIGDLIKLHHLGVMDELNLKVGRVGGVLKSIDIINYCEKHEIPCWVGGMFETGIGRTQNLQMASYLPNARAHDQSPSDRYFLEDIVLPGVQMKNGYVDIESLKNCEIQTDLLDKYTVNEISYGIKTEAC